MNLYDWNEIKRVGDCTDICRHFGLKDQGKSGKWTRYNNPWRPGSDSGAFSVSREGYKDHVSGESGSIIDLVANIQYQGDIWRAQEWLGEYYKLESKTKAKQKRKFVCAYDYTDLDGVLRHQTVRWDPKKFSQRRPDPDKEDTWIYNLEGIEPILYRMADWHDKPAVCVVGGEKDADNLLALNIPATTNPMGEGNWRDSYNQHFKGKKVYIIPDNDEAGRRHAEVVASALHGIAAQIKVVALPDVPVKGDASDYINAGHGRNDIQALVKAAPEYQPSDQQLADQKQISEAKQANAGPFRNFDWIDGMDGRGKEKKLKQPRHINDMRKDVYKRFWDFPRRVGGTLFDHDRDSDQIRFIESSSSLFAWISEKSGHAVEWERDSSGNGMLTKTEFYESIHANSRVYQMISGVPSWPARDDVYYTHGKLPPPTQNADYFHDFCSFFNVASGDDRILLAVCVASPLYYRPGVDRPLWVIDAESGQGTGKTKLVEMISRLYGGDDPESGEPIWVDYKQLNNETMLDRVQKRLLSRSGRKKRIVLIDNVEGHFRSPALASMTSQSAISGMAPYGHGEETRPNDLTYYITSNSASLDSDLISRAIIVHLQKPEEPAKTWELDVSKFIREHRLQIIADMIAMLERGSKLDLPAFTRFRSWEREVMMPIINDSQAYSGVCKTLSERWASADVDREEAEILRDHFRAKIKEFGFDPDNKPFWLTSGILTLWSQEIIPEFGGKSGRSTVRILRNLSKSGKLPELDWRMPSYPHRGDGRTRGMMWNIEIYREQVRKSEKEKDGIFIPKTEITVFCIDTNGAVGWRQL